MENQQEINTIQFEKDGKSFAFIVPKDCSFGQAIDAAIALVGGLAQKAQESVIANIKKEEENVGQEKS